MLKILTALMTAGAERYACAVIIVIDSANILITILRLALWCWFLTINRKATRLIILPTGSLRHSSHILWHKFLGKLWATTHRETLSTTLSIYCLLIASDMRCHTYCGVGTLCWTSSSNRVVTASELVRVLQHHLLLVGSRCLAAIDVSVGSIINLILALELNTLLEKVHSSRIFNKKSSRYALLLIW